MHHIVLFKIAKHFQKGMWDQVMVAGDGFTMATYSSGITQPLSLKLYLSTLVSHNYLKQSNKTDGLVVTLNV